MQKNRGRPRTGWNHKRKTISYPKGFEIILRQVKEWDPEVSFSKEFVKAIRSLHEDLKNDQTLRLRQRLDRLKELREK